ncbi:MAG: hypothetical protein JWQ35_121 [Bacteriovoracaceae bacterium]|nr:hypothetical protein [Bacteriovoracaceae bacterium]
MFKSCLGFFFFGLLIIDALSAADLKIVEDSQKISTCMADIAKLFMRARKAQLPQYIVPLKAASFEAYRARSHSALDHRRLQPVAIATKFNDVPSTLLITFSEQELMNLIFLSASAAIESKLFYPNYTSILNEELFLRIQGHDLKVTDLNSFLTVEIPKLELELKNFSNEGNSKLKLETVLNAWYWLQKRIGRGDIKTVIAGSAISLHDFDTTVAHEVLHAHFFNSLKIYDLVMQFFTEQVSPEDKEIFYLALDATYDHIRTDYELAANEFFAYTNARGAAQKLALHRRPAMRNLVPLIQKYNASYLNFLNDHQVVIGATLIE